MQKVKILFIGCLLSATLNAQTVNKEQVTIHQTVESMFATLTNADTSALRGLVVCGGQPFPALQMVRQV